NVRNTPFVENARQAELGNSWMSNVVPSPVTGLMQIWMTRPVMEANTLLGMIGIPVHTAGLAHYLESEVYRTGRYFTVITDTLGNVAYSNRPDYVGRNIIDLGMAPSLAQLVRDNMFEYTSTVTGNRELAYLHVAPENGWMIISGIDRASRMATIGDLIMSILPALLMTLITIITFLYVLRILKPIDVLAQTLNDIANGEGDLTARLSETGAKEIADTSRYFNQTMEKIRGLIVIIKKQAGTLSDIGNDLSSNMTETASSMNQINANIQNIRGRVMNQSASVTETNATMEQVTGNINKLSNQVDRQTNAVSQASSAVEEMLANIQSVTATLVKNASNVRELQESSETGRSSLQEVATDIQEISRESEGLLEINAVMESIASQTNLLSMNAAIEAAHAGEAGRGFSVVADEIRKLAESSGEQSKTISSVLKKIKESIDSITWAIDNVLNKFEAIDRGVKTVVEQEETIRRAMEEQGEGSKQMLQASGQVSEITQQVKSGSAEMLEGSREVIQESKNLERVTQEITNGMNEMAAGTDQVNKAVNNISELSNRNRENISSLVRAVSQFKV
ncbi:MAG: methyl-accepting chemotaxis protein, partial [Treponema sp.]|nr:methyl-accepting chemotaxis protein [Treponema sp.]